MMRPSRRILGSFVLAPVMALVLAGSTLAAGTFTYRLGGFEIAATSTVGTFVGVGTSLDDLGTWSASIVHSPLSSTGTATISAGGSFRFDGAARHIAGTFTGGSLAQRSGSTGSIPCTNQTYNVIGQLALTVPSSGSGTFSAILTHYRVRLFGRCIVYAASVQGGAVFAF